MNYPGDGRLGAGRIPARRHHRPAPQSLLLEGRRGGQPAALSRRGALQALDLGRPRRAGGGRLRRLLQPRAAGKLRRVAEALGRARCAGPSRLRPAHHRLLALPELLGQWLGRSGRARPGGARTEPQRAISARRSPRRSTGSGSATRWSRVRSPPSIPAASMSGTSFYDKRFDRLLSVRLSRRAKAELAKAGLKDTDGDGFVNFPAGRRAARMSRSRCWSMPTTRPTRPRRGVSWR